MKKSVMFIFVAALMLISLVGVFASNCNLKVSLVNQDPYPAVQGDTVKLLFQVSGVQNPNCGGAIFRLDPGYSFSLQGDTGTKILSGSTYTQNYNNDWAIPYTLNVNKDAPDGIVQVEGYYSPGTSLNSSGVLSQVFNVSIQDSRADFEVYVKNYDPLTNTFTLQILNIAKVNIKALTVEVPKQDNIQIKGSNVNIVGDLDSNEYTTADFDAVPSDGNITLKISYSDQANVRRTVEKTVVYDSKFFDGQGKSKSSPVVTWIIVLVVVGLIVYWYLRRKKKKRLLAERRRNLK